MELTTREISFLATAFTEKSILSPFFIVEEQPSGTEYQSLADKGVIVGDGYDPKSLSMLTAITKPERSSRVKLFSGYAILEKYAYRSGNKLIMANNLDEKLQFFEPVAWDEILFSYAEFLGSSTIINAKIEIELTEPELLTLITFMDLNRKSVLRSYLGEEVPVGLLKTEDIVNEMEQEYKNGLLRMVRTNYSLPLPEPETVNEAIGSLVEKGCLAQKKGYRLKDNYQSFAINFLIPSCQVVMEAFSIAGESELAVAREFAIAAGLHDIVSFWSDGESYKIETINSYTLLDMIEHYLKCPDLEEAVVL